MDNGLTNTSKGWYIPMKNIFDGKSNAYTLKATLEAVDAFTDSQVMQQISATNGAILNLDPLVHDSSQMAKIHDGIEKLTTKARADRLSDIITRTFGLFDEEMTELGAKKSELLAKDNVKNYKYKHHIWRAGWYSVEYDNIFAVINHVLYMTRIVVDKNSRSCSAKFIQEEVDKEYKAKIDGYIETRLCGWTNGAYAKYLKACMLGDCKKEVVKEFNFQDDWSISDMLDWERKVTKEILDRNKKLEVADLKDMRAQIKDIIKKFHDYAKLDPGNAKIYGAEIKRCIKYTTFLCGRLDEFLDATFYSLQTQRDEIHKVLKGLLEYNGD